MTSSQRTGSQGRSAKQHARDAAEETVLILINVFLDTSAGVGSGGAAGFGFIGISILIAAGVSLETMKQVDSQLTMRNYEGFLK